MEQIKELIKYAVRAPSGHNTQPWKFIVFESEIQIHPDHTRVLPVVDSDNHALWISLGCALENLVIAGGKFGFKSEVNISSEDKDRTFIKVKLFSLDKQRPDELFDYIGTRQSTRNEYEAINLSVQDLNVLKTCFDIQGINARFFSQDEIKVLEPFIIEGSNLQFKNKKFVTELVSWFRFFEKEAKEKGDGLWTACMGLPKMNRFIGNIVMKHFVSAKSEAKRWKKLIHSSSGLVLFVADKNDIEHWVNLGRAFQRFGLTAAKLNISHAHVNMPCEEIEVRKQMTKSLDLTGKHPLLLIRFGYSDKMTYSFRRPVEDVIFKKDAYI
ncbi:MAG: hypothetical protein A2W07_06785 [candidate division Zixibacteria bacterium RBG_16_43_9]|nr:MAG: hypothetical protein A2W07_06785 [candidate division Zixibacteria bacterium RBG_16_43_9]